MDASHTPNPFHLGFVSIRERSPHGYFGGFLVINELARPLEFHCTLPLQPSRAQRILFGPTLDEFVCGEQIARAMLGKVKTKPTVVLTDTAAALSVRHWIDVPIFWLQEEYQAEEPSNGFAIPSQKRSESEYASRVIRGKPFYWLPSYTGDGAALDALMGDGVSQLDLREPFGRIVEALAEAHPRSKVA
ncbi:MAG: hypothetical protein WCI02_03240 [Planctomycetota bacterium]|jgi:hypothetical protein